MQKNDRKQLRIHSKKSYLALAGAILATAVPTNAFAVRAANAFRPGTYTASANGYRGEVKVAVDVSEQNGEIRIDAIRADRGAETESKWKLLEDAGLLDTIKENGGPDGVDTVSKATVSSRAVLEATGKAIDAANSAAEKPAAEEEVVVDPASIFDGGTGTAEDPYIIRSAQTLQQFAQSTEAVDVEGKVNDYAGVYIALDSDVELTGEWKPIGSLAHPFKGDFDGRGHRITGLHIGSKEDPAKKRNVSDGFFGNVAGANIRNLAIDAKIYAISDGAYMVGALAGTARESRLDRIDVTATIVAETTHRKSNLFVGGIVGSGMKQEIYNCTANVDLRSTAVGGTAEAGGIVGITNRGIVANCRSTGKIGGSTDRVQEEGMTAFGGIAGVNGGTIVNTYSCMDIVSDSYTHYVGAVVGWATGIADTFQSYYDANSILVVDDKTKDRHVVSPSIPIGWAVGAGVTEDGVPYTGSVALDVEAADLQGATKKLDANITKLCADLSKGGRQEGHWKPSQSENALNRWVLNDKPSLIEERIRPAYDAKTSARIESLLPKADEHLLPGAFYGRSRDGSVLIRAEIDDSGAWQKIETLSGSVDAAAIGKLLRGEADYENLPKSALKEAIRDVMLRSKNRDFTGYGMADVESIFAAGKGTVEDPYIIQTREQFINFAASINADESYADKYIRLDADMILTDVWMPAGSGGKWPFKGHFNGGGHTIYNMCIGTKDAPYTGKFAGLFTYIDGGEIHDLRLKNYEIHVKGKSDQKAFVGAVAPHIKNGMVNGIEASGTMAIDTDAAEIYAGGLFSQTDKSRIVNVRSKADLIAKSGSRNIYAGGVVGLNNRSLLLNGIAAGTVQAETALNRAMVGGIVGMNAGVLSNFYADVFVHAANPTGDAGTVAGRNTGIGYMYDNFYHPDKVPVVAGKTTKPKAIGTVVEGTKEVKGEVADNGSAYIQEAVGALNRGPKRERIDAAISLWLKGDSLDGIILKSWKIQDGVLSFADPSVREEEKEVPRQSAPKWRPDGNVGSQRLAPEKTENSPNEKAMPEQPAFIDSIGHWAAEPIRYVVEKGYFKGISPTQFAPDGEMTREMFVTVLGRRSGISRKDTDAGFRDVKKNAYSAAYIRWARDNHIVEGIGEDCFAPDAPITREEMATMLDRYAAYARITWQSSAVSTVSDMDEVSDWAKKSVEKLNRAGLVRGRETGIFDPKACSTRAEIAQILYRLDREME